MPLQPQVIPRRVCFRTFGQRNAQRWVLVETNFQLSIDMQACQLQITYSCKKALWGLHYKHLFNIRVYRVRHVSACILCRWVVRRHLPGFIQLVYLGVLVFQAPWPHVSGCKDEIVQDLWWFKTECWSLSYVCVFYSWFMCRKPV